jgi:ATP-dependent Clp protease ATP-binding subunit ClpB
VDIQLRRMQKYFEAKRMTLDLTDKARALLASEGYDPAFGARPLKRVMQRKILDALATEILKGNLRDGDQIVADVDGKDGDGLTFRMKHRKS